MKDHTNTLVKTAKQPLVTSARLSVLDTLPCMSCPRQGIDGALLFK